MPPRSVLAEPYQARLGDAIPCAPRHVFDQGRSPQGNKEARCTTKVVRRRWSPRGNKEARCTTKVVRRRWSPRGAGTGIEAPPTDCSTNIGEEQGRKPRHQHRSRRHRRRDRKPGRLLASRAAQRRTSRRWGGAEREHTKRRKSVEHGGWHESTASRRTSSHHAPAAGGRVGGVWSLRVASISRYTCTREGAGATEMMGSSTIHDGRPGGGGTRAWDGEEDRRPGDRRYGGREGAQESIRLARPSPRRPSTGTSLIDAARREGHACRETGRATSETNVPEEQSSGSTSPSSK